MKPSLWDLKRAEIEIETPFWEIMKPSLWDLKLIVNNEISVFTFHHEAIPMGFETCHSQLLSNVDGKS